MHLGIFLIILFSKIFSQHFIDITDESGTEVSRHQSSFFGAGVTMVDFDNDDLDDIIVEKIRKSLAQPTGRPISKQ